MKVTMRTRTSPGGRGRSPPPRVGASETPTRFASSPPSPASGGGRMESIYLLRNPIEEPQRRQRCTQFLGLFGGERLIRQPRVADGDAEHCHHRFRGTHESEPNEKVDEVDGALLFLAGGFQISA